jgi:hypothetical protein
MCAAIASASAGVGEKPRRAPIALGRQATDCDWTLKTHRITRSSEGAQPAISATRRAR